jgi:type I pantothenate kinase
VTVERTSDRASVSPFVEISRADWAALGQSTEMPLTEQEISQIRGLGDFLDVKEVADVYLPLSQLLNLYVTQAQQLHSQASEFLGERAKRTPFIIGVAGSVAVGKSTVARLLKEMLSRWPSTPRVELVTTDGFLHNNAELERRNLMHRKGFPESYDRLALLKFVADIKSGVERVSAPVYSHLSYDIVPGAEVIIESPDVVIVEGLNVLQPPVMGQEVALSDYFDFKIYVDAEVENVTKWFIGRFEQARSPTRSLTFTATPRCPSPMRWPGQTRFGEPSTCRTCSRTSSRPALGPPWCSARAVTTRLSRFCCERASSRRYRFVTKKCQNLPKISQPES